MPCFYVLIGIDSTTVLRVGEGDWVTGRLATILDVNNIYSRIYPPIGLFQCKQNYSIILKRLIWSANGTAYGE
jgi:hypothetical protein